MHSQAIPSHIHKDKDHYATIQICFVSLPNRVVVIGCARGNGVVELAHARTFWIDNYHVSSSVGIDSPREVVVRKRRRQTLRKIWSTGSNDVRSGGNGLWLWITWRERRTVEGIPAGALAEIDP